MNTGTLDFGISDHLMCFAIFKWKSVPLQKLSTVYRRSMKNFNQSDFNADLEIAPWSSLEMFDDPSDKTEIYNLLLSDILDLHAPLKKVKTRCHCLFHPPYFELFSLHQEILRPELGVSPPSYLRNLLTNVSDIHQYHTRGAARGHLHVNQVHKKYGKKAISNRLTHVRNSY